MSQIFLRDGLWVTGSRDLVASIGGIVFRVFHAVSAAGNPYGQVDCGTYEEGLDALFDSLHDYSMLFHT